MNKITQWAVGITGGALILAGGQASAVSVGYDLANNGGGNYTYTYTVDNTGAPSAIQGFNIEFDETLYDELSLTVGSPAGWDGSVLGSIPSVAPAAVDWCSDLGGGFCDGPMLAVGGSATGFMVTFDWIGGPGGPASQPFFTYDDSFNGVSDGDTVLNAGPGPGPAVPEPSTLALYGLGLGLVGWLRRCRC